MGLLPRLHREHARKKAKRPFRRTAHAVVSAIALKYGLKEDFLAKLGAPAEVPAGNSFIHGPFKKKKDLAALPFFLADAKNYLFVKKILQAADCPYITHARSPDEILLARPLFAANSGIRPELLEAHHFETLFLAEIAKSRVAALSRVIDSLAAQHSSKAGINPSDRTALGIRLLDTLRGRIQMLNEYISFIETPNESEEGR